MGVLWVGYLPISIYLSFSPSKCVCVCATPTAKIRYSRLCWLSLVRAASRILILQAWRWGMNTCGARETHVLRFSVSPILRFSTPVPPVSLELSLARGEFRCEGSGMGMCPYRILSNINTHSQTRARSLSPPPLSLTLSTILSISLSLSPRGRFL